MPFPARLVRPIENRHPNLSRLPSASRLPGVRAKKIFVIKQEIHLPQTNAADDKIQIRRILIFDDHPDSLRLVFGRQASPHFDLSRPPRVSPWELILASILTMAALIGMFWPLF
jgi:hypothetical protein